MNMLQKDIYQESYENIHSAIDGDQQKVYMELDYDRYNVNIEVSEKGPVITLYNENGDECRDAEVESEIINSLASFDDVRKGMRDDDRERLEMSATYQSLASQFYC